MNPRRPLMLVPAAVVAAAVAVPALAADPSEGTVSNASPSVTWKGNATGYGVVPTNILVDAAGEDPLCPPAACDTFALKVADPGDLTVTAQQTAGDNFTELHVIQPDGSVNYAQSEEAKPVTIKIKKAVAGDYTVEVLTNETATSSGEYDASARLGSTVAAVTPPAPTVSPQPTATATPDPGAAPSPTLKLKTRKTKARRSIRLRIATSGPVTGIKAVIARGSKRVATARLKRLDGTGTLRFKARRAPKAGRYVLTAAGRDAQGRTVGLRTKLRLTR